MDQSGRDVWRLIFPRDVMISVKEFRYLVELPDMAVSVVVVMLRELMVWWTCALLQIDLELSL